jgi:hypothetical protein
MLAIMSVKKVEYLSCTLPPFLLDLSRMGWFSSSTIKSSSPANTNKISDEV